MRMDRQVNNLRVYSRCTRLEEVFVTKYKNNLSILFNNTSQYALSYLVQIVARSDLGPKSCPIRELSLHAVAESFAILMESKVSTEGSI